MEIYSLIGIPLDSDVAIDTARQALTREGLYDWTDVRVFRSTAPPRSTILVPPFFQCTAVSAGEISRTLGSPAILLRSDFAFFWAYVLFADGQAVDQFATLPGCLGQIDRKNRKRLAGDARVVANHWPDVDRATVKEYLVQWDGRFTSLGKKARPEDEFASGSGWQVIDFMRCLGLPIDRARLFAGD